LNDWRIVTVKDVDGNVYIHSLIVDTTTAFAEENHERQQSG
jgi:hypothetical protein